MVKEKVISGSPPGLVYFIFLEYSIFFGVSGTVAGFDRVVVEVAGFDEAGGVGVDFVVVVVGFEGAGVVAAAFGAIPLANCRKAADVSDAPQTVPIESPFAFFPTIAPAILSEKRLI